VALDLQKRLLVGADGFLAVGGGGCGILVDDVALDAVGPLDGPG
jgi:hypothetical protein